MIKKIISISIFSTLLSLSTVSSSFAIDDNAPLYMKGHLNPMYMGKIARVLAEIVEIKEAKNRVFYKVNPKMKGVQPFWVTNFAPVESKMTVGDELQFIGHVKTASKMDPSGELEKFLGQPTFLVTRSILSP